MPSVDVEGGSIGYEERGCGTPVVFLHGVGTDRRAWKPQLAHFGRAWRAVALDYPGYGESDRPGSPLSRAEIAGRLLAAWDALGVEEAHVVGLSMGGVIALELARAAPARLLSLTMADSFAHHPEGPEIVARAHSAVARMTMAAFAEERAAHLLAPGAPSELREWLVGNMGSIDPGVFRWASTAVWTADYRADLAHLRLPALVLIGEHDMRTPMPLSEALRDGIPGARLAVVPEAGHLSNLERSDDFNSLLEAFLRALPPPSPAAGR